MEEFVLNSNNGTMFHRQAFLDYHPNGKFNFIILCSVRTKSCLQSCPAALPRTGVCFGRQWAQLRFFCNG
jgi:hypothetical protein